MKTIPAKIVNISCFAFWFEIVSFQLEIFFNPSHVFRYEPIEVIFILI